MFQQLKNIDTAFKHIKLFSLGLILACTLICCFVIWKSYSWVSATQGHIYILANGKALEAFSAERKDNIPVEARDHVRMFHYDFFTLDPDDKAINTNITKALYLADASAKMQYDNLRETGYYANIISGNISQQVEADSVEVNTDSYPYHFRYTGKEKIIRTTSIITRSLVCEGYLRNVARSDNNPHGFLIEKWTTIENKDLKTDAR